MFFVFALILVVPLGITVVKDLSGMMDAIGNVGVLSAEQKIVYQEHWDMLLDDIVIMTFYIFLLMGIVSLVVSRRMMSPVISLRNAMLRLASGAEGVKLNYAEGDEMGEAARAFNSASRKLDKVREGFSMYREAFALLPLPAVVMDEDYIIKEVSPTFGGLFGYSMKDLEGYSIFELMEEDCARSLRRKFIETEYGESARFEASMFTKDVGVIPVTVELARFNGAPGAEGVLAFISDLRGEYRLLDALNLGHDNTEIIIDSIDDLVVLINRDFEIVSANLSMRVKAGRNVMGEKCHSIIYGEDERCYLKGNICAVKEAFEISKPFRTVVDKKESGGKRVFYDVTASPLRDAHGEIGLAVVVMRDVTDRMRMEQEIERKNYELSCLNEIPWVLSHSLGEEGNYGVILDKVCELFGMDGGGLYLLDEMGRSLRCDFYKGLSPEFMKDIRVIGSGEDIPGRVAASASPIFINDISVHTSSEGSAFRHTGIRSFACVPVRGREKLMGTLFLFSFNENVFMEGDQTILGSISEMLGISIDNAGLYARMKAQYEQDIQRRADEQKDLLELASMLASSPDMDVVLEPSLDLIKKTCWADLVCLLLLDNDGGLVVRASTDPAIVAGGMLYDEGHKSLESMSMHKGEPLVTGGITSLRDIVLDERLEKFYTAACIPIYVGDRVLGAMSLYYSGEIAPSDNEVHFLRTVCSVLGVAMERTRLIESGIAQKRMAETVLESIGEGVMTMTSSGEIVSLNRAASGMFVIHSQKAVGMNISQILVDDNENFELREYILESLAIASRGNYSTHEATMLRPDGVLVPLAYSCSPVYSSQSSHAEAVFVFRNLSELRKIHKMKTDFVRSVSHEFRTPLTAIIGMTEMLLDGEVDDGRVDDYMQTILVEAKRLANMVSEVLDVARIEAGAMEFTENDVNFVKVVQSVRDRLDESIKEHQASLSVIVQEGILFKGDVDKLSLMIGHLVENSLMYSDRGVKISVHVRSEGEMLNIMVIDNGWGIPVASLPRIGEKFYRARTQMTRRGAGLGISICREMAAMHGGTLTVQSTEGEGTEVMIALPIGRAQ